MTTTELNTKVDAFIQQWLGKRTDFDGAPAGSVYQCVDLLKRFWNMYWGLGNVPVGRALNYISKPLPAPLANILTQVRDGSVKKGDAVILYTSGHDGDLNYGDGHIGLATGNTNATSFEILEQNGSTGNGKGINGDLIRRRWINRSRLAGVLRPKVVGVVPAPTPPSAPSRMPAVGSRVRFMGVRTAFVSGTVVIKGMLQPDIRIVRGYDPKYSNRILVNSAAVGNGVAVALYDFAGNRIDGWQAI